MQQSLPYSFFEACYKAAVQIGVSQALLDVLHGRAAFWVVHHNVKHLFDPQLSHCLVHVVAEPALPLLQAASALTLYMRAR